MDYFSPDKLTSLGDFYLNDVILSNETAASGKGPLFLFTVS